MLPIVTTTVLCPAVHAVALCAAVAALATGTTIYPSCSMQAPLAASLAAASENVLPYHQDMRLSLLPGLLAAVVHKAMT